MKGNAGNDYLDDVFFRERDSESEGIVRDTIDKHFKGREANVPELNKKMQRRCFEANSGFRENEYRVFIGKDLGVYAGLRNLIETKDWDFDGDKLKIFAYIPEHDVPYSMERRVNRTGAILEHKASTYAYATSGVIKSVKDQEGDLVDAALGCMFASAEDWLEAKPKLVYFDSAPMSDAESISQTRLAVEFRGETYWGRSRSPGVDGAVEAAANALNSAYILNQDPKNPPPGSLFQMLTGSEASYPDLKNFVSGPLHQVLGKNGFDH